jgi:16S rRNA (guanine527-N7)-methyltransferase
MQSNPELSSAPPLAADLFGPKVGLATRYVEMLAETGIDHGLIGPGERPRLWDRHVLNCAVISPAFGPDSTVIDVGSGAGLPGIVLAIMRPDLQILLVERLRRRTIWLQRTLDELALANVEVHLGRAESLWKSMYVDHVTARAVARLGTLGAWCLPLLRPGGSLLAIKGENAQAELDADREALVRLGAAELTVESYGAGPDVPSTVLVRIAIGKEDHLGPKGAGRARAGNRPRRTRAKAPPRAVE